MGTRGAIGFVIGGQPKITYNHYDSYPDCVGKKCVEFVRDRTRQEMLPKVFAIELVNEDSAPSDVQIAMYKKFHDRGVSSGKPAEWYSLLRKAQGDLDAYVKGGLQIMVDSREFLYDSLWCEYAYIVNLDENVLEFYVGGNQDYKAAGRYAAGDPRRAEEAVKGAEPNDAKYAGVALKKTWRLDILHNALTKSPISGVEKIVAQMNKLAHKGE